MLHDFWFLFCLSLEVNFLFHFCEFGVLGCGVVLLLYFTGKSPFLDTFWKGVSFPHNSFSLGASEGCKSGPGEPFVTLGLHFTSVLYSTLGDYHISVLAFQIL